MASKKSTSLPQINEVLLKIIGEYNALLPKLSKKKNEEIHRKLWSIRAKLELFLAEIEHSYNLQKLSSKLHKDDQKMRGTKIKKNAIKQLKLLAISKDEFEELYKTNIKECFVTIWNIKETISLVLNAFPTTKYQWIDGSLEKQSDKIFEI